MATVYYEFYSSEKDLKQKLLRDENEIQCIVGKNYIPFGLSQSPLLNDYADNIDTMSFLQYL